VCVYDHGRCFLSEAIFFLLDLLGGLLSGGLKHVIWGKGSRVGHGVSLGKRVHSNSQGTIFTHYSGGMWGWGK